jgi:hypothetical protein
VSLPSVTTQRRHRVCDPGGAPGVVHASRARSSRPFRARHPSPLTLPLPVDTRRLDVTQAARVLGVAVAVETSAERAGRTDTCESPSPARPGWSVAR